MTDGQKFFDQPVKNTLRTFDSIQKIETGQEDDYTAGSLLDYNYFRKHYKLSAVDLSKQQALEADPKSTQQINLEEI